MNVFFKELNIINYIKVLYNYCLFLNFRFLFYFFNELGLLILVCSLWFKDTKPLGQCLISFYVACLFPMTFI